MESADDSRDVDRRDGDEWTRRRAGDSSLGSALDAAGVGAWTIDLATGRVRTSGVYARLLRGPGAPPDFTFADYGAFLATVHPDDRDRVATSPVRIVAGDGTFEEELRVVWPDGAVRWLLSRGQVIRGEGGQPVEVTGVLLDVTDRKAADEERAALLAREQAARAEAEEAGRRLAQLEAVTEVGLTRLGLDDLLREILVRVHDAIGADSATILLLDRERNHLVATASVGVESEVESRVAVPLGAGVAGGVAASETPRVIEDLDAVDVFSPHLRAAGLRSLVAVPLVVEGAVIGVLHAGSRELGHFGDADIPLLRRVADRVALAVDRARAFEEQHLIAETLQHSLLPHALPDLPGVELAARYVAGAPGASVGGDWYDAVATPDDRLALVIGDVGGRGVRAASVMGQLRAACRIYLGEGYGPGAVLSRLNRLANAVESDLTTMALLLLDARSGSGTLVSAGHPPPAIRRADGTVELVTGANGLVLGASPAAEYEPVTLRLGAGDSVVLYTDGLIEHRGRGIDEGLATLREELIRACDEPEGCCDELVRQMTPPVPIDDVAVLIARMTGVS